MPNEISKNQDILFSDIRQIIEEGRNLISQTVNVGLTLAYWSIGKRIRQDVLDNQRAEYGQQIVSTLSRQLSWSHFKEIIYVDSDLAVEFYTEMCRIERWNVRTLREKIQSMLFEHTAISQKPDELARKELQALREEDRLSPDLVFRNPYVLDFLGLKGTFLEKDLEQAILDKLEHFLLELGRGFAFLERQKRMIIDGQDYKLDLLFYHRKLKRLIDIDLKIGKFKAEYKGQRELYLRWLEKHETDPDEGSPI